MSKDANPLDVPDWVDLVAERAARKVIDEHRRNCPIDDVKRALFGNGTPGLKTQVQGVQSCIERLTADVAGVNRRVSEGPRRRGRIIDAIIVAVITAVLIEGGSFLLNRSALAAGMAPPPTHQASPTTRP